MRSESAIVIRSSRFLRPRAVFLFRHTSRLGGTWRGDVCHWVMAFVLALERRSEKDVQRTGSP